MDNFFAKNLHYLRTSKGLSLDALSSKINCSKSVLGSYEQGKTQPTLGILLEIVRYFGCSMSDLVDVDLKEGRPPIMNEPPMIYGEIERLRIENSALRDALKEIGKGINQKK